MSKILVPRNTENSELVNDTDSLENYRLAPAVNNTSVNSPTIAYIPSMFKEEPQTETAHQKNAENKSFFKDVGR